MTGTCWGLSIQFQFQWFERQSGLRVVLILEVKGHCNEDIKTNSPKRKQFKFSYNSELVKGLLDS